MIYRWKLTQGCQVPPSLLSVPHSSTFTIVILFVSLICSPTPPLSIYLPYQPLYDDLNYIILCVLYLKSHTSRTQQQFVDDVDKRQTAASCTN